MVDPFSSLNREIITCKKCTRLVQWRKDVAKVKVKRFREWDYWGKPVPGFGDPRAQLLLVGLAPAAHGANRTGRMFTGDESGNWLFRALHKAGFVNQPTSNSKDDGLKLLNCYITATCRCAPPQNKVLPEEIKNCRTFIVQELQLLKNVKVIIGLGKIGFDNVFLCFRELQLTDIKTKPTFSHGAAIKLNSKVTLIGSYHPSQQNTFTGKLTEKMFDDIFSTAKNILLK